MGEKSLKTRIIRYFISVLTVIPSTEIHLILKMNDPIIEVIRKKSA